MGIPTVFLVVAPLQMLLLLSSSNIQKLKFNWQLDRRSWLNYDSGHHLHNKKTLRMNDINEPQTHLERARQYSSVRYFCSNTYTEKLIFFSKFPRLFTARFFGHFKLQSVKNLWTTPEIDEEIGLIRGRGLEIRDLSFYAKTRVWKGVDEADKGTPKSGRSVTINSNYKERLFKWNRIWGWTKWAATSILAHYIRCKHTLKYF